jgi:hypothetical protein
MLSQISLARHAVGLAALLAFALDVASPVRAADDELARYKRLRRSPRRTLPSSTRSTSTSSPTRSGIA